MVLASNIVEKMIVDKLDLKLTVKTINDQEVTFKCLKWFKLYGFVIYNNEQLTPTEIDGNTLTFDTEYTFTNAFSLKKPLFLCGTLSNTKEEWNRFESNERKKLPFIWLVSPTRSSKQNDRTTPIDLDLSLWFVHWSDWSKLNKDRQDEAIKPLLVLVNAFLEVIETDKNTFLSYSGLDSSDFPKFGTTNKDGIEKKLFDSTLSAIELTMNLKVNAENCNC
jgi:hypothetical protein